MPIESSHDETSAWLTLLRAPALGASGVRELIDRHGSAAKAVHAALHDNSVPAAARVMLRRPDPAWMARDLAWLEAPEHHLLTIDSDDYPPLLREIAQPPAALFVVGDVLQLWSPQIAVVGSRNASHSGLDNARAFAAAFVRAGNTITSGLAEGVDGAAHGAALDVGGRTIAVFGTGPDLIYPRRHRELAHRVAAGGALVSEFPPGTPGKPEHFPSRNRIIAGLSLGTLVIEAGLNSGSLITARLAAEQGREVFALPGSIHNPLARGCHRLIRNGVRLVETAEEVLEGLSSVGVRLGQALRERIEPAAAIRAGAVPAADPDNTRLLAALDREPASLDVLVGRSGLSAQALSSMLLVLELEGIVGADAGTYWRR